MGYRAHIVKEKIVEYSDKEYFNYNFDEVCNRLEELEIPIYINDNDFSFIEIGVEELLEIDVDSLPTKTSFDEEFKHFLQECKEVVEENPKYLENGYLLVEWF